MLSFKISDVSGSKFAFFIEFLPDCYFWWLQLGLTFLNLRDELWPLIYVVRIDLLYSRDRVRFTPTQNQIITFQSWGEVSR